MTMIKFSRIILGGFPRRGSACGLDRAKMGLPDRAGSAPGDDWRSDADLAGHF
jgi:hypothetical protein